MGLAGWSLKVGRIWGIEIRLHWIFLLWAAFELLRRDRFGGTSNVLIYLGFLFSAVLLHEFGHCFAARRVGGSADSVLLWPLGGLALVTIPQRPREQFLVAAGGPAVNLILWLLLLPWAIATGDGFGSVFLGFWVSDPLSLAAAVNFDLLIFNLIPALPLDGGNMLKALISRRKGEVQAIRWVINSSRISAVAMAILWISSDGHGGLLLGIALLIWLNAAWLARQVKESGYEPEPSWKGESGGGIKSWWQRRRDGALQKREERAAERHVQERQRVDDLLDKVSREGVGSLTSSEKKFLDEVSRRYRQN